MQITTATLSDLGSIQNIYFLCSEDMKTRFDLNHWDSPYPEDILTQRLSVGSVYKITDNSQVIATFMLSADLPQLFIEAIGDLGVSCRYLTRLAILPEFQSKGVGGWCMNQAERIASGQGAEVIYLDILASHPKLTGFYEKCGYKTIGRGRTRRFEIRFFQKTVSDNPSL